MGLNFRQFYCCGELKSITITLAKEPIDKCGKGDDKSGCCKTKLQYLKVKDNHLATGDFTAPDKYYTLVESFTQSYPINSFVPYQAENINGSHSPPLHPGVPVYISNQVFRI